MVSAISPVRSIEADPLTFSEVALEKSSAVLYSSTQSVADPLSVQLSVAIVPLPGVRVATKAVGVGQASEVTNIALFDHALTPSTSPQFARTFTI